MSQNWAFWRGRQDGYFLNAHLFSFWWYWGWSKEYHTHP